MNAAKFTLVPSMFLDRETVLLEWDELRAVSFRYPSGVCGLKLQNERGEVVVLPFQGQQIWSARMNGRDLTMKSMFDQPHPTQTYLENYGGFLIHCGATAMGVPEAVDHHPLHGELPNAPYERAWLIAGTEQGHPYLEVGGQFTHTVAFNTHYVAEPHLRLPAGKSTFHIGMSVHNLKRTPMDLMYLAHINFRPVNQAELMYSAAYDPAHVRVRTSIPSHVHPAPGFREFLEDLAQNPAQHHHLSPDLNFDPEVVFYIDYATDADGWAHTLQILPDGQADYVRHKPAELRKGVRWICRTPDQDALGMILPATAEPEGFSAEKAKGNVLSLAGGETFAYDAEVGALTADEVAAVEAKIEAIRQGITA